jgi:hypothetical protein
MEANMRPHSSLIHIVDTSVEKVQDSMLRTTAKALGEPAYESCPRSSALHYTVSYKSTVQPA